jgi:hypothetical protein
MGWLWHFNARPTQPEEFAMATKPNYQFEKRQRELAKQKKKQEKAQRKSSPTPGDTAPADLKEQS